MRPSIYMPERVGQMFTPNVAQAVAEGRAAGIRPSPQDSIRTILLLVDMQVDFVHEDGALSVPGAVDDARRTIEWIYDHSAELTTIAASLDSHLPLQIFSSSWWIDAKGQHPNPYTVISSKSVADGTWQPLYEPEWSRYYVQELEKQARKELMIWPYHTLLGTPGHSLTPALYEAIAYHSAARQSQPVFLTKGSIPKTEHYSILEPEVKVPDQPSGELNVTFLEMLASYDRIYIAGQAKSHCVLETVSSIMRHFARHPRIIAKMRVLTDCTSSVRHPEIDFDRIADETFADFARRGLMLIKSVDGVV